MCLFSQQASASAWSDDADLLEVLRISAEIDQEANPRASKFCLFNCRLDSGGTGACQAGKKVEGKVSGTWPQVAAGVTGAAYASAQLTQ